MKKTSNNEKS